MSFIFQKKRRNLILQLLSAVLLYPILKFAGFSVPRKPNYVKIGTPLSSDGVLVTKDFILFDKDGSCWALSRKCTHLGCRLHYKDSEEILECPCHQSRFIARTGAVLNGPAKTPLKQFPVEKRKNSPYYIVTT
jgi:Rieske Fe-S protein